MCVFDFASGLPTFASLILTVIAGAEGVASGSATSPPAPAPSPWVGLAGALAWPIAAIAIALAFRKPLSQFLSGLSGRVTKLSAFKVELELATAPSAAAGPLLDDIRSATTSAEIADSTRMMLEQAQSTMPADFAVIDLGAGEEWLTSRLFIASVMLEKMRGVQVFVFLESTPAMARRFVAIGSLAEIRWSLACRYPWLEAAWQRAYLNIFPAYPPSSTPAGIAMPNGAAWLPDPLTLAPAPSPIQSYTGALDPIMARTVVGQFIQFLQVPPSGVAMPAAAPASVMAPVVTVVTSSPGDTWVTFASGTQERAAWMTRSMLETMLPAEAFDLWMDEARDAARAKRTRALLRRPGPFVALVRGDREYCRLVNRQTLLEELAAYSGEEPE
jgi:hypothetical protein